MIVRMIAFVECADGHKEVDIIANMSGNIFELGRLREAAHRVALKYYDGCTLWSDVAIVDKDYFKAACSSVWRRYKALGKPEGWWVTDETGLLVKA